MLHPLIRQAKTKAESYRIKQSAPGRFNVWRFRSWDLTEPGWRIVAITSSPEEARAEIETRLCLSPPVIRIMAEPAFRYDEYGWP